jgi:hypothetical protein
MNPSTDFVDVTAMFMSTSEFQHNSSSMIEISSLLVDTTKAPEEQCNVIIIAVFITGYVLLPILFIAISLHVFLICCYVFYLFFVRACNWQSSCCQAL